MAVVFPTKGDQTVLLSFMSSFELPNTDSKDDRNDDTNDATFCFCKAAITTVESSCGAILESLQDISSFFTGGGPLTGRNVLLDKTAFTSGSVFPHTRKHDSGSMPPIVLSDVSAADVFGIANPVDFFAAQQDELVATKVQLESARETLQTVNREHGYVWTGNRALIRRFLGSQGDQSLSLLYEMSSARARMKAAPSPRGGAQAAERGGHCSATALTEAEAMHRFLALPEECLPGPAVKAAYARFIQSTTMLIQWLDVVLQMVKGEDDVPKSGTYSIPAGTSTKKASENSEGQSNAPCVKTAEPAGASELPEMVFQAARTRTVRVRRFEIHDAHYTYDNYLEQTKCFFLPEYTQYDARVQRRLLQPAYFNALRDLLTEMSDEIARLTDIASRKDAGPVYLNSALSPYAAYGLRVPQSSQTAATGDDLPQIVFRPPLSSFRFLRDSLHIYLSTCINEDDTSSLLYYEHVYNDALERAREVARTIQQLPKPPKSTQSQATEKRVGSAVAAQTQDQSTQAIQHQLPPHQQAPSPRDTSFGMLQVDHAESSDVAAAAGRRLSGWPPTHEERGILVSGFEAYWGVRERIFELRASLTKDIKQKDRTHGTRVADGAVAAEVSLVQKKAEAQERQFREHERKTDSSSSLWGAMKSSLVSFGNALTCKAELNPSDLTGNRQEAVDDEGFPVTTTSPFHAEKQRLCEQVNRLWAVMEAQGVQLEATYPGVFFRGEREKWVSRVGKLVKKAEGVSVVFSV